MGYGLTQWHRQYRNGSCIIGRSSSILYIAFRNIDLEIIPSTSLFVALPNDLPRGTNSCKVLSFSTGLLVYTEQVKLPKLMFEIEHSRYWVSRLFLLVLFWAGSIQRKLVEHFYRSKSLISLWQNSSKWFKRLIRV